MNSLSAIDRTCTIRRPTASVTLSIVAALATVMVTACDARGQTESYGGAHEYTISDTALVSIGGQDDRPAYQLHYVISAMRLSEGLIVIANAGHRDLRYYDAQGRHVRTVGGSGEGPGEFNNVKSVGRLGGDTVAVLDAVLRRVTLLSGEGEVGATVTLVGWGDAVEDLMRQQPGRQVGLHDFHPVESGAIVVEPFFERTPDAMEGSRVAQDTVPLLVFDRSGTMERALGPFPAAEVFLRSRVGMLLAFGERLSATAAHNLVYVGSTRDPTIRGFSANGQLVRSIHFPAGPRPLSPQDRPEAGSGPAAEHVAAMPMPDSMPLFRRIVHGADGRLWVQRYRAPGDQLQEWLGFDEAGDLVASLAMDRHLDLQDIGSDYVLLLQADDLGVQEVRLHGLVDR